MGIMDKLFGGSTPAPAAPAAVPAAIPAGYSPTTAGTATAEANGVIPPEAAAEAAGAAVSPLDEFKGLWDNPTNTEEVDNTIFGTIDPKMIAASAGKLNFAGAVSKEDIAAIQAGGEGAVKALGNALNATTQAVYAQSALASSKLIEAASAKLEERILGKLPEQVRRNLLDNDMVEENAAYSHPAAVPIVKLVQNQLATKYPNATPTELRKMAQQYFDNSYKAIGGDRNTAAAAAAKNPALDSTDWDLELGL